MIIQDNYQKNNNLNVIKISNKISLFNNILENVEKEFKIIKELNILKFLIFVDNYISEGIWNTKIKDIIIKNFKKKFMNRNLIKIKIILKIN